MKLLITDAHNPLGHAIGIAFESETFTLLRPEPAELDWCDADVVMAYLKAQRPEIIINTVGWSEAPVPDQQRLLVTAAKNLARGCMEIQAIPIHLSSYQVFGAENKGAYDETDQTHPPTAIGRAFVEAERHFDLLLDKWVGLRLSWLIGARGSNHLTAVLDALSKGENIEVCRETRGVPTSDGDVARVIVALAKQILCGAENWGVFHYCSADACAELDFVRQVAAIMEQEGFTQGQVLEVGAPVDSVAHSRAVLTCRRVRDNFGIQLRSWRQGLHSTIKLWLREHPRH